MEVFCINEDGWAERKRFLLFWHRWVDTYGPSYGEVCLVTGESEPDKFGEYYLLKGWSKKMNDGYNKDCFIPIREEKEENEEVKIKQLTDTK